MCWRNALPFLLFCLQAMPVWGDGFPYTAFVNSSDVYVRSGPGRDYYPTDKLQKGEAIEVYRHDPGGWLAIRPPRGSYSWVAARHLDPQDHGGNLASVNAERVVARVGSTFSHVRDVIQVRLERGELVELIEDPAPDSPWCKIAPPAGEFRWIFAKYVDRNYPEETDSDPNLASEHHGRGKQPRSASSLVSDDEIQLASAQAPQPAVARIQPVQDALSSDPTLTDDLARLRELEQIDLQLSEIVAEDISQWSFIELQHRTDRALQAAQSSLERGRARVLLDKLERFDDIKRRHDALRTAEIAPASTTPAKIAIPQTSGDRRFDGMGRLQPVVSQNIAGPQYALLDEAGAVLSFVTPAPGVNLRPFVDKMIGVNGQRGYLTDLQRQHVSVQRVTLLESTLR